MAARSQTLRVVIAGDASSLEKAFAKAQIGAGKFGGSVEKGMGRATKAMVAFTKVGAASLGVGMGAVVKSGMEYEKVMARVAAVTSKNGKVNKEAISSLDALNKKLSKETQFSATEAAGAMEELGKAGYNTTQITKMMAPILDLATASGESLASSSELVSAQLHSFGLKASDSGKIADTLTYAVNASAISMEDMKTSLEYIGPVAKTVGYSLSDVSGAIELLGNMGIKGDKAGTGLRGGLVRLLKPTKQVKEAFDGIGMSADDLYDGKGKLKKLPEILKLLETHLKGTTDQQKNMALAQIFGTNSLSTWNALLNKGSDQVQKWTDKTKAATGTAKDQAKIMGDTVSGAFKKLRNNIETAGISVYQKFQPALKDSIKWVTNMLPVAAKLPGKLKETFDKLKDQKGSAGAAIGEMLTDGFKRIPWDAIGQNLSAGFRKALSFEKDMANGVQQGISQVFSHIDGAKVLGGLLKIVSGALNALTDPKFWADHWKDILSVAAFVVPLGKIFKIPGVSKIVELFSRTFGPALKSVGGTLGRLLIAAAKDVGLLFQRGLGAVLPGVEEFFFRTLPGAVRGAPGALVSAFEDGLVKVTVAIERFAPNIANTLMNALLDAPAVIKKNLAKFAIVGGLAVTTIARGLWNSRDEIGEKVKDLGAWMGKAFITAITFLPKLVLGTFTKVGEAVWNAKGDIAGKAVEAAKFLVKGYIGIMTFLPRQALGVLERVGSALVGYGGQFLKWGGSMATKLVSGFAKFASELPYKAGFLIGRAIKSVIDGVPKMLSAAGKLGGKLVSGTVSFAKKLPGEVWDFIVKAVSRVASGYARMGKAAANLGGKLIDGVISTAKALPGQVWDFIVKAVTRVISGYARMGKAAANLGGKLIDGVISTAKALPGTVWHWITAAVDKVIAAGSSMLKAAVSTGGKILSGFGKALHDAPGWIAHQLKLMANKIVDWGENFFNDAKALGGKIADGIAQGVKDGVKKVGGAIEGLVKGALKYSPVGLAVKFGKGVADGVGDGWGRETAKTMTSSGGQDLHGALPIMGPFAAMGAKYGLQVSAGKDDHGTMTNSGNVSWHSSGHALDLSNGYATPQELTFARFLATNFGSQLKELIHTPLGFSIKNGQRTAPFAQADHYDHVHVAFQQGGQHVGPGGKSGVIDKHKTWTVEAGEDAHKGHDEIFIATNPTFRERNRKLLMYAADKLGMVKKGDKSDAYHLAFQQGGIFNLDQLKALWVQAGGPANVRTLMAHVAMAESTGNPSVKGSVTQYKSKSNPDGRAVGLWQILGAPTGWSGSTNWANPLTNAKAAVKKYLAGGTGPWVSSRAGWGKWASYRDSGSGAVGIGTNNRMIQADGTTYTVKEQASDKAAAYLTKVNKAQAPLRGELSKASGAVNKGTKALEGMDSRASLIDRIDSFSEENLDTSSGRARRTKELSRKHTQQNHREKAIKAQIELLRKQGAKYAALAKRYADAAKKAPAGAKKDVLAKMADYRTKHGEVQDAIAELGGQLADLQLDIMETEREQRAVDARDPATRQNALNQIAAKQGSTQHALDAHNGQVSALKKKITQLKKRIKTLTAASKKKHTTRAKRRKALADLAKAVEEMADYQDALADLNVKVATDKALLAALAGESDDINADQDYDGSPDEAEEVEKVDPPTTMEKVDAALNLIDLQERAGDLTKEQAQAARAAIRASALNNGYGDLTEVERLQIRGDVKEANDQALADNTAATSALSDEVKALADQVAKQNAYAEDINSVSLAAGWRALGDMVNGQIGGQASARAQTAGAGTVARY